MRDGKRGHATGVIVLCDGRILGGDTYFFYTGSYSFKNGKWRGELITHQHTEAVGVNLAFGGLAQDKHTQVTPDAVIWKDNPAFPKGVQVAALVGDQTKAGDTVVLRIKFPANFPLFRGRNDNQWCYRNEPR